MVSDMMTFYGTVSSLMAFFFCSIHNACHLCLPFACLSLEFHKVPVSIAPISVQLLVRQSSSSVPVSAF